MAIAKGDSSKRRRSIAVPNQNQQSLAVPTGRRRAHSIVPGERLSVLEKVRRSSLVPRKSILKTSSLVNTEEPAEPLSQPSNSQSSQTDEGNVTQSMEFTVDYRARVHDNASRKSLGRRVSFAEHAHVRLFQIPNHDNTNSTGSPQSSPIPSSSPDVDHQPVLSNENEYPGARNRQSSVRPSIAGSEDMDFTSANPGAFLGGAEDSALLDQEMHFDDDDEMEVTEMIPAEVLRRRSLAGRQPFAPVRPRESIAFPSDDAIPSDDDDDGNNADQTNDDNDHTQSMLEDDSQMHSVADNSQDRMEFTVPMGQSLRPPPTEDPVWLALRQMTHSGDTPHEPEESSEEDILVADNQEGMKIDDAVARLMRARESMATSNGDTTSDMDMANANASLVGKEDSLLSTDDSLNDEVGDGNETLNISKIVGRMSLGYQDSTMDESGIYGSVQQPLSSSTPRHSITPFAATNGDTMAAETHDVDTTPRPAVFQAPAHELSPPSQTAPETVQLHERTTNPPVFTFVPPQPSRAPTKPISPVKQKPKHTFSAAFAPPVTRPSPKKYPNSTSSTPVHGTPSKRPFSVMQDGAHDPGRPSPAKRPALTQKATSRSSTGTPRRPPVFSQPRPSLSPKKLADSNETIGPSLPAKRQSGYFARRKSLGTSLAVSPARRASSGRASLGSASSDAWTRFDRNAPALSTLGNVPPSEAQRDTTPDRASQPSSRPDTVRTSPVATSQRSGQVSARGVPDQPGVQRADAVMGQGHEGMEQERTILREDSQPEEDMPSVSIQQFFSLTGIKFMDELTAPRRSIHPGVGNRQARNPTDIPLSEYYIAMAIDVPQLGLFTRVSKDLDGWMARSKADFAQAEEEAAKITPELFVEFMRADEEGQAELLHQLNLIRANARGQAKSDWYDWKLKWVEGLQSTAEQAFSDLQKDAKLLEPIKKAADELVPTLEKEYNDVLQELEREQAEVAEIEASDHEYLNDLKVSIAEQNIEVEALRAELSEHTEQLNYLQGRLQELAIGKKEATDAITKARYVLQMKENSTRTEVFRLRDELATLEDLHRFRIAKVDESLFEYIYASHFRVVIPCNKYLPITSRVEIIRADNPALRTKDDFPKLSSISLQAAKALVHRLQVTSCKQIIHYLSDYWSSCSQLRTQLRLLAIKYPIDILPMDGNGLPGFKARTKVMIPSKKAKVFVTFDFTPDVFSRWPISINSLTCSVEVSYGPVDQMTISQALSERLSQATPTDNYACLLDACIEAQEIYNQ